MSSEIVQVNFRMPAQLKARLEEAATANHRTLTAEIIDRLEASFLERADQLFGRDWVGRLVNDMADELDRRGAKIPTIRKRFDDYDPSDAREKAINEAESKLKRKRRGPAS